MVDFTKPVYGSIWANEGEKLSPDQSKIAMGWIQEMMPYQYENYLQNRTDVALSYLLQKGIAEWSADQEYTANKSVVTYGGQLYMATATVTNILPTVAASWKKLSATFGVNGAIPITFGGTGATTAADARTNLGIGSAATVNLPATNGIVTKLANNSLVARTITGTAGYITVTNGDAVNGDPVITVGVNVAKTDSDTAWTTATSIKLPSGSTAERGVGAPGRIRYNIETGVYEGYDNTGWNPIGSVGAMDVQSFPGDGLTTSFTLSITPRSENNTQVYFNGIYQNKSSYTLLGNSLIFDEAPTVAEVIEVVTVASIPIGTTTAAQTSITDSGNYYDSSSVEGALQEVGLKASFVKDAILSYPDYAAASAAAATLPNGQEIKAPNAEGRLSRFEVQGNALVFKDYAPDAIRMQSYTALRTYTGNAQVIDITSLGVAGCFYLDTTDTTTADNGGTVIVDNSNRRWKRLYSQGSVHVDWFGAKAIAGSEAVNRTAILAAHNYCAGQTRDKRVLFGAGNYPFNTMLQLRGIVEWEGPAPGGSGTTLEWTGSADVALSLDPQDWAGNYQGTFRKIRIARNASASRAVCFDLIKCSEYEFQDVYVSDMGTAFRLRGAPINYFDRIVTADCDVVFEYQSGAGLFANAMHVITRCNFWETHDSVFKFTSGVVYSLFFHDNWVERFGTFIKDGQGDAFPFSMKDFRVRDCHILSVDSPSTRLIWYKAKPSNIESSITRVSFQNTIVALNSSDHICLIDNNGNTAAGTNMFSELSFHDVHAYGAPTALVSSNKFGTTVRVTGDTLAQQGYYTGNQLVQAHNQARPYETNKPQYFNVNWTGDGATQPSLGNGVIDSNFVVESGWARVKVTVNFGTTTVQGNGVWRFSIPYSGAGAIVGTAFLQVPGTANYACTVTGDAANGFVSLALNTNGNLVPFGVTTNSTTSLMLEFSYAVS